MDMQFYPTPKTIAQKMWAKFRDRDFKKVLEPSAGGGALIDEAPTDRWECGRMNVDSIEIDGSKHPLLKGKSEVVGFDFMAFENGSHYGHVIMNPPFAVGAQHVLKAWDLIFDGEIVALLNAETLRNPYSKERQLLARIVEQHGEVEFIQDAFKGEEVDREADVEVALVYLCKRAEPSSLFGDIIADLRADNQESRLGEDIREVHEVALPNQFVENTVLAFKAAVEAMRQAVVAEARAGHYAKLLGSTMAKLAGQSVMDDKDTSPGWIRKELASRYSNIKDRAWTGILRSTQVSSRLSSGAQDRLEAEFENIKRLEFSESNIYGFLAGLANSGNQIQIEMICECFDKITRWHAENTVFYMGWSSNSKHRTNARRVKMTRFIIPGNSTDTYAHSLNWNGINMLRDYDKCFALLDGKESPDISLESVFRSRFDELKRGARLSTSYFDVRYFPGVGTTHFFPRNKALIDRLNRVVGRHRKWLPESDDQASKDFWTQYDRAEKFDSEIRKEFAKARAGCSFWSGPSLDKLFDDSDRKAESEAALAKATEAVLERHGINVTAMLEQKGQGDLLLLAAA